MPREPVDSPVALSVPLMHDPTGSYTAEIRRTLDTAGISYRIIDREFPEFSTVVPSGRRNAILAEQGQWLLENHGGDVIIFGRVASAENTIHIGFFGFHDGAFLEHFLTATLFDEVWQDEFAFVVQAMMTESALDQFMEPRGLGNNPRSVEGLLDAVQTKLTTISRTSRNEFLMERTRLGIRLIEFARAKLADDLETISRLRAEFESDVREYPQTDDSPYSKALRLQLADLYMIEGLMSGNPTKIDRGMRLAMATGKETMQAAMADDHSAVQVPESAHWTHWFLVTVLVLACDDKEMMKRVEELLHTSGESLAETAHMNFADYMGMLIPLSQINSLPNHGELSDVREYLTSLGGVKNLPRWQDPFTHALRLLERRLSEEDPELETQCPSLQLWMSIKGWTLSEPVASQP